MLLLGWLSISLFDRHTYLISEISQKVFELEP